MKKMLPTFWVMVLLLFVQQMHAQSRPMGEMLHLYDDSVTLHKAANEDAEVLATLPIGHPIEVLQEGDAVKDGWHTFRWLQVKTRVDNKIWEGWLWSEHVADFDLVDDWDGDGNWEYLLCRNRTYLPFSDYRIPLDQSLLDFKYVRNGQVVQEWNRNVFGVEEVTLDYRPRVDGFDPEFNCIYISFIRATGEDSQIEDTYLRTITDTELIEALHYYTLEQPGYRFEQLPAYPGEVGVKKNEVLLKVDIRRENVYVDPSMSDQNLYIWNGTVFEKQKR